MMVLAEYFPFAYPILLFHDWWYVLVIPLSFGISMVYKAMRLPSLEHYWRQVVLMTAQIVLAMIGMDLALIALVQWVIPMLPAA